MSKTLSSLKKRVLRNFWRLFSKRESMSSKAGHHNFQIQTQERMPGLSQNILLYIFGLKTGSMNCTRFSKTRTRFFTSILSSHVETWYKPTQKKQVPEKNHVRIKYFAYLYIFLYKMIKKIYNVSVFCHSLNMIKVFILNKKIYNV